MISHRTQKKFQQPEEKNKEDNIENVLGALLIGGAALYAISSMFSNSEENTSHSSSASSSSSSSGDDYEAIYNHNKICKGIEKACLAECESLPYNSGGVLLGKFPQSKCRSKCWNAHRECKK